MAGTPKKRARKLAGDMGKPKPTSGVPTKYMRLAKNTDLDSGIFTENVVNRILLFIRTGCYVETAVRAAGVGKTTFYKWLRLGATGEEPYASFTAKIEKALGTAEANAVIRITEASAHDWRAAAWKLERMFPKRYGPSVTVGIDMPKPPDAGMDLSALSIEELRALKYLTAKARGQLPANFIDVDPEEGETTNRQCAKEGHVIHHLDKSCARCGEQLIDVDPEEGEDEEH
jgi:hypothetical protein